MLLFDDIKIVTSNVFMLSKISANLKPFSRDKLSRKLHMEQLQDIRSKTLVIIYKSGDNKTLLAGYSFSYSAFSRCELMLAMVKNIFSRPWNYRLESHGQTHEYFAFRVNGYFAKGSGGKCRLRSRAVNSALMLVTCVNFPNGQECLKPASKLKTLKCKVGCVEGCNF